MRVKPVWTYKYLQMTPSPSLFSCTDYIVFALMHFGIQTKWTYGCFSALSSGANTVVSIGRFFWLQVQPFFVKFEAPSIFVGPPFPQVWKTIYEMPDVSKKEKTPGLFLLQQAD